MRSNTLTDGKLYLKPDLTNYKNDYLVYLQDNAKIEHLVNQLLLYDKIIIPTKDFSIIPILVNWFGLPNFFRLINAEAFEFAHTDSLLSYLGNGHGISGFVMYPGKNSNVSWWQQAMFGSMEEALHLQISNNLEDLKPRQVQKLFRKVLSVSKPVQYENQTFIEAVAEESYKDIIQSKKLTQYLKKLTGPKHKIDLKKLSGINPNQMVISSLKEIKRPVDLVLNVAEVNMTILISSLFGESDFLAPEGTEYILASKYRRVGIPETQLSQFFSLLELTNIPNPGAGASSGSIPMKDIFKLRNSKKAKKFRKWLSHADTKDSRELEKLYVSSLGKKSIYDSLPVKTLRFTLTNVAGFVLPGLGIALDVADSLFIEKWLNGYTPKIYLDKLSSIAPK